jgi:Domain of unknown function (DUF397)
MLAPEHLSHPAWRKSSYSGGNESGSNCVEVAGTDGVVAVRDSKDPGVGALAFSPAQWRAFVAAVKAGGG